MRQAAPWMKKLLPIASKILPWITVGTGVRSEDCGDAPGGRATEEKGVLYHRRISIGWGRELRDVAEEVGEQFPTLPVDIPILFTQGGIDPICPPEILEVHLQKLPTNQFQLELIPDARHEPFSGSTAEYFLARLNHWIENELS